MPYPDTDYVRELASAAKEIADEVALRIVGIIAEDCLRAARRQAIDLSLYINAALERLLTAPAPVAIDINKNVSEARRKAEKRTRRA